MESQQPSVRPISREQQLQLENEVLKQQMGRLMQARGQQTMLTMGELMDGIAFSIKRAEGTDEEASEGGKKDLTTLQNLLKKVIEGDWTLRRRIVVPR